MMYKLMEEVSEGKASNRFVKKRLTFAFPFIFRI